MELPSRPLAYVPEAKITRYLLDLDHPKGKGNAGAFRGRGYDDNNVEVFIQDLIALAHTASVINVIPSPHGMKYVVDGEIYTPDGRPMNVHTIWMIDTGQDAPRLISAYPDDSEVAT
jgi:hypothetical protein